MISQSIAVEGITLILSLFWGMVLAFEYDCIRVFRRIIKHKKVWLVSFEDIIFWINTGFMVFSIIYELNNGIVRGFVTAGFVVGALVYRYSFGIFFVKYMTLILQFILKPLKKIVVFIIIKIKHLLLMINKMCTGVCRNTDKILFKKHHKVQGSDISDENILDKDKYNRRKNTKRISKQH